MLAKMYLTNFLSFKERTEIDLTASKYSILGKTNVYKSEILKGALFIGPNASGKSNALKGRSIGIVAFFQTILLLQLNMNLYLKAKKSNMRLSIISRRIAFRKI